MVRRTYLLLLPLCLLGRVGTAQTAAPSPEPWLLMARHGECAPVASLRRKVPDLGDISDPQSFAALMRRQGFEVSATQHALPKGKSWEVRVPAKELALVFVTPELCQSRP